MPKRVRITGPAQIVASIPALLGFHPDRSLVAVFSDSESGRVHCLVRVDVDTPAADITRTLLGVAARLDACRLVTVVYADTLAAWVDSAEEAAVKTALEDVRAAQVTLTDSLLVTAGRWWSLMCTNPDCCPPEGQPIPTGTTVVEAERVTAGLPAVASSRETAGDRYALRSPLGQDVVQVAQEPVEGPLRYRCYLATELLTGTTLTPEQAAELMVLLQDVDVRDWVLADLAVGPVDAQLVDRLVDLALTAPDRLRPRLAGTSAAAIVMRGDNPVGLWAMVDHGGEDSLAHLAAEAVLACVPPPELCAVFTQAREQLAARVAGSAA